MVALDQFGGRTHTVGDHVKNAAMQLLRHLLGQARQPHTVGQNAFTIVGQDLAGEQTQQRRLALAVAPQHADAALRYGRSVSARARQPEAVLEATAAGKRPS